MTACSLCGQCRPKLLGQRFNKQVAQPATSTATIRADAIVTHLENNHPGLLPKPHADHALTAIRKGVLQAVGDQLVGDQTKRNSHVQITVQSISRYFNRDRQP